MEMLRIAICEDTAADMQRLETAIDAAGAPCAIDRFESGEAFLNAFHPGDYDLVFLDVFMAGMTGVDAAQRVREVDPDVMLVFATTSPDFTMEGYRNRVERYLVKPYDDADVAEALEHAQRVSGGKAEQTYLVAGEEIPISQIRYVEQRNHTVIVHRTDGGEGRFTGKLDAVESVLPCPPFYRGHKSYLVNLDHVRRVDRDLNAFEMDDGEHAYIRRASVREAQRAFEARLIERTKAL